MGKKTLKENQKERKNGKGERMKRKEDQAQFPLDPFHLNERKREEGRGGICKNLSVPFGVWQQQLKTL